MLNIRLLFPLKDKNKIIGYRIQDTQTLQVKEVSIESLKNAIRTGQCIAVNATLTSDNRIVTHIEKVENKTSFIDELKLLSTDDFQHRGGNYPKSNIPVDIEVYNQDITANFKSTEEKVAITWLSRYLTQKGFKFNKIEACQIGDYHNDWVQAYTSVTGKQ